MLRGLYLLVALAFWGSAAVAAFTEEDAIRIGREANVEGLRALAAQHTPLQRSLLSLLARQIDKHERYPKYRTRKLFDLRLVENSGDVREMR